MSVVQMQADRLMIDGKAQTLLCASLFYFRVPSQDWETRMVQLRSAGYNCIDVYLPWNFHELEEDVWCFEGMHDCDRFLSLAAKHNLYVVARPGPYICSEWDGGALPSWLGRVCSTIRQDDDNYLRYLSRWLDKILPIIAAHQVDQGGSVVALQLENEMDFFACQSPATYMAKLRDIARSHGITVPLIACAGECDVQGAGGDVPDVCPTFNAYSSADFRGLETQLAHMRTLAMEQDAPLMITETDREHCKLKREILAGARLVSPYNQVGGTDVDMTNGISNWSGDEIRPLALMATDYDFVSMITVDGRLRGEAIAARLLGQMILSLGEHLASGVPAPCPTAVTCDFPSALSLGEDGRIQPVFPTLQMDCGMLVGVSNLGTEPGHAVLHAGHDKLTVTVNPNETLMLPWQVNLTPWHADASILWAEAEISQLEETADGLRLTFAGQEGARACLCQGENQAIVTGSAWQQPFEGLWVRILPQEEAARMPFAPLPDLTGAVPSQMQVEGVDNVLVHDACIRQAASPLGNGLRTMEDAGVYRGDVFYETTIPHAGRLMMTDPADFVWITQENGCTALYCDGSAALVPVQEGPVSIRVQSWGHVNFDDVRQPSLKMGSHKGVSGLYMECAREDITELWFIFPDAKYAAQNNPAQRQRDRILATTINTWSFPATPMQADFVRRVHLPAQGDSFFLFIEKPVPGLKVKVNGQEVGAFRSGTQYLPLPGLEADASIDLCLTIQRQFSHCSVGRVEILSCQSLQDVAMHALPVAAWQALRAQGEGKAQALPVNLKPGEECILTNIELPGDKRSRMLVIDGCGVEATLVAHGHVVGRVELRTENYPPVCGGSSRRIYLPLEWCDDSVCLHLCGIGPGGQVTGLHWETVIA